MEREKTIEAVFTQAGTMEIEVNRNGRINGVETYTQAGLLTAEKNGHKDKGELNTYTKSYLAERDIPNLSPLPVYTQAGILSEE